MQKFPNPGSNSSIFATFPLIFNTIAQAYLLEPYSLPGSVLVHQGREKSLGINNSSVTRNSYSYSVNGDHGIRLEAKSEKGCFVYSSGGMVKLRCDSGGSDDAFLKRTSFVVCDGISHYHPISFVAKGLRRNFLWQPLFSLRDEHYTLYFNINT